MWKPFQAPGLAVWGPGLPSHLRQSCTDLVNHPFIAWVCVCCDVKTVGKHWSSYVLQYLKKTFSMQILPHHWLLVSPCCPEDKIQILQQDSCEWALCHLLLCYLPSLRSGHLQLSAVPWMHHATLISAFVHAVSSAQDGLPFLVLIGYFPPFLWNLSPLSLPLGRYLWSLALLGSAKPFFWSSHTALHMLPHHTYLTAWFICGPNCFTSL